jgi:predicted ATPase/class 3 adenylate cyclase
VSDLPTGTVTFLFTDIEGSTRLLQELGDGYRAVQDRHGELVRAAIRTYEGHEIRTEGDSFFVAFRTPAQGVRAAVEAQRALAREDWAHGSPLRVRMGLHTGEGVLGGGDYLGVDVNRTARIAAAGHGGQVLLSDAIRALVEEALPDGARTRDLGSHSLKDFDHARHLFDLVVEGLPADFPPIRSVRESRRVNLPAPRTSFVGRDRELAEIGELLTRTRLLTLTGPGGTGKTRLALRAAADQVDRVEDGVILADLSSVTDPELVPSTIASALGLRQDPATDTLDAVAGHLRDREVLLVLDNVEQVAEAAPDMGRLLDAAPRLRIMATSRVPLHVSGEHEYLVGPLPLPDPRHPEVDRLTACESVMLFAERAASVRRGFGVTEENAGAIAEITTRLDGLPLAIELAASRIKMLSPRALLERLERRLPILTGGPRDLPERQRTLRRAIEWSHDLLEDEERRLFARLAAFRGGWTLEAAEDVSGPGLGIDVMDGLASLVDKSLVRQQESRDGDVRFRMLETIHEFGAERLAGSGEEEEVRRRHAEHIRDLVGEAEPHLRGAGDPGWLARLEREHDNVRAALDWCQAIGDVQTGLRTAAAMWRFWNLRSYLAEGRDRVERALALPGADAPTAARARALGALGGIAYWQNDYETMAPAYEEAVDIAREVGDRRLLSQALFDLSFVPLVLTQDFDRQREVLEEALTYADESDPALLGQIWSGFGFVQAFGMQDPGSGVEPVQKALDIHREYGEPWLIAEDLVGLAGLRLLMGEQAEARRHLQEAVMFLSRSESPVVLGTAVSALAVLMAYEGDHVATARLFGARKRITDEGGGTPPPFALSFFGDPEAQAREALGDDEFDRAHAEGYAMTMEQGRSYARELVGRRRR